MWTRATVPCVRFFPLAISGTVLPLLVKVQQKAWVSNAAGLCGFGVQATSLMRLDNSPSIVLFDAIQSRIVEISKSVKPEEKEALEEAFNKLGYGHEAISKKV